MSVPAEAGPVPAGAVSADADVIVLRRRPGPALSPGDLVAERRPLREPGPGEVVVRNLVTTVDSCADLRDAVFKRITLRGFIVSDYYPERLTPIRSELGRLPREKRLRAVVSEFDGLGRAPEALATVFDRGSPHIGRRVVRIAR